MKISGERILVFGDSMSHHGADFGPEIWDVDQGSDRPSSAPGDLLASMLAEQGAEAVRIDANVGRSAVNFWQGGSRWQSHSSDELIASDQQFAPTKVIVFLGTNDLGMDPTSDGTGFQLIAQSFPNADIIAIGPPVFADPSLNLQAGTVYQTLRDVFGASNVIDARPLSSTQGRAGDGIHFGAQAAQAFAANLFGAVQNAGGMPLWQWAAIGAVGVGLLVGAGLFLQHRETHRALQGTVEDEEMAEQSLSEEEQAIEDYGERGEAAEDPELATIFEHNRGEEEQHAETLRTWQHGRLGASEPSEGFDVVMKKWKRGIAAYKKAIQSLAEGSGDTDSVNKARNKLDKILYEATAYLPGYSQHPLYEQLEAEKKAISATRDAAEEQGQKIREQSHQDEIKRLREEEREAKQPYEWMHRRRY